MKITAINLFIISVWYDNLKMAQFCPIIIASTIKSQIII